MIGQRVMTVAVFSFWLSRGSVSGEVVTCRRQVDGITKQVLDLTCMDMPDMMVCSIVLVSVGVVREGLVVGREGGSTPCEPASLLAFVLMR